MTTLVDIPPGVLRDEDTPHPLARYAALSTSLRRCRDFCVVLALLLFLGRSAWAWLSGRSWIVGPDAGAVYVVGFPLLFLLLGARDLSAWFRLRKALQVRARRERRAAPWRYVAAGAVLGASATIAGALILRTL
jgi:hypothetical protein